MKPVAWIDPFDLERLPLYDCWVSGEKTKKVDIPLYTHPVKELTLTDDEVMDLWNQASSHPAEFARAILRKAQE